jgi:hypothetical protein
MGNSCVTARLAAAQEGLSSMELDYFGIPLPIIIIIPPMFCYHLLSGVGIIWAL